MTIGVDVTDYDGLKRVSLAFHGVGGTHKNLKVCDDDTSNRCVGNKMYLEIPRVNPADYGASPGSVTVGLHVQDEQEGNVGNTLVDSSTFTWSSNNPAAGNITSPSANDSLVGNITLNANATDLDGLNKVSISFAGSQTGNILNLCDDADPQKLCNGNSDSWQITNINPADYGANPGSVTIGLHVKDDKGYDDGTSAVKAVTFNWSLNSQPSGNILNPTENETKIGKFDIKASAKDLNGLKKVSIVFVENGTPLVLCDDSTSNKCNGTEDTWTMTQIDPAAYGATEGKVTMGLHVQDEKDANDASKTIDVRNINWEKLKPTTCIGHDYEQRMPKVGVTIPTANITASASSVKEETSATLTAISTVDSSNGGKAFYYWCTDKGGFMPISGVTDFNKVTFVAPLVPARTETATITLRVGDGLGYVATKTIDISITDDNNHDNADPQPVISVTTPPTLKVGENYNIAFALSDKDDDGDGVDDSIDNCQLIANTDQKDADNDGKGDLCDTDDSDGDGIADNKDNCINASNADQWDSDRDGLGDLCDDDDDDDGIPDDMDNCFFKICSGAEKPATDVALKSLGATVISGRSRDNLIDGVTTGYTKSYGFGYTVWTDNTAEEMIVKLDKVYTLNHIDLLLWDGDDRYYQYYIETSTDGNTWTRVIDKTNGRHKSWQRNMFQPSEVEYIKIVGTYGSVD
ncbi:MAG: thrombospondin type 3 repeat-containing protein, partial [Pseudomonadota bacterium]